MPSNTVRVNLQADAKGFEQGFDKAQAKAVGFGAAIGSMAGIVAADLGTKALAAVKDFAADSIRAFSDLEQAQGGTQAIFGDSADAIEDMASRSAEALGLSEAEFRNATTAIGGQLKRMTGDVDFAAEHSVELTGVAADLAATFGGTTKQAVEALGSAFRGEADPAERFNLDLKIGRVNAKAVELGLADTTASVDDYARAQALLALITEQSADAQGQFAREADTVAGKMQRLTAETEDAKASMGEGFAPVWLEIIETGNDFITVISGIGDTLGNLVGDSQKGVAAFLDFIPVLGSLKQLLGGVADAMTGSGEATSEAQIAVEDHSEALVEMSDELGRNVAQLQKTEDSTYEYETSVEALKFEEDRQAAATRAARDAIYAKAEALRNVHDPISRVIDLGGRQLQLEKDLAKAVAEYGENSKEAIDISLELAGVNADLRATFVELKESGIDPTGAAARTMFEGFGLSDAQIDAIFAQFRRIEEANPVVRITVDAPNIAWETTPGSNRARAREDGRRSFHTGGIIPGPPGADVPIIAQAGEEIIPRSKVNGRSGGIHFHGPVYGMDDFERKLQEVIVRARRKGIAI